MVVDIFFEQFLKEGGNGIGGGGIGTEISYLCPALAGAGYSVTVYQCAEKSFETEFGGVPVIAALPRPKIGLPTEVVVKRLRELAATRAAKGPRVEIFMADFFSEKNDNPLAIAVQQGLSWDADINLLTHKSYFRRGYGERVFRASRQLRGLKRFETCFNRVAVDLYFINWYRSFRGSKLRGRVYYNPNPAPDTQWTRSDARPDPIRIIFARRLVPEKGTGLAAEVLAELLQLRPNVRLTIAGEGAERERLASVLGKDSRVEFISYDASVSLEVHARHDIALVPSLCGEGTSLSIAEAMAAGCAVVATNMGGVITQIIDGYNGLLCWPNRQSILAALLDLIDHPDKLLTMQRRAHEVAKSAFGLSAWKRKWLEILDEVVRGEGVAQAQLARGRML